VVTTFAISVPASAATADSPLDLVSSLHQ
jgi:hypothetical protein